MPAAIVPTSFRRSGDPQLASYQFSDLADGTGVVQYYLGASEAWNGATNITTWILTEKAFYSDVVENDGTATFVLTAFNAPRTIKGTATLNVGIYMQSGSGGATPYFLSAKIQKVSGGVTTDCCSAANGAAIDANGAYRMTNIRMALTETDFKRGDVMQLVVTKNGGGPGSDVYGTDPQGRNGTFITSALASPPMTTKTILSVPFRIDS